MTIGVDLSRACCVACSIGSRIDSISQDLNLVTKCEMLN